MTLEQLWTVMFDKYGQLYGHKSWAEYELGGRDVAVLYIWSGEHLH